MLTEQDVTIEGIDVDGSVPCEAEPECGMPCGQPSVTRIRYACACCTAQNTIFICAGCLDDARSFGARSTCTAHGDVEVRITGEL